MTHTSPISRQRVLLVAGLLLAAATVLALPYRAQLINKFGMAQQAVNPVVLSSSAFAVPPVAEPAKAAFFPANPGIAPTGDPGGFDIDGNLQANTPTSNVSDWLPNGATGVGVLDAAGVPLNPMRTFHAIDLYDSTSDNIFAGGLKVNDDPNMWTWVTQKPPGKNEIQNGLVHVSTASNGNIWFMVAGDRLETNGSSYIDFEFLQRGLVANGNGTFTSAGTQGGRTVGDVLLTIAFESGGSVPTFFTQQWAGGQPTPSGFDYVDIAPPSGSFFMTGNSASVPVSFGVFGATTYAANQFAEAAINATALLGSSCFNFTTVLIKTKTSQSVSATIKDFIDPIQLDLGTQPLANAGPDQSSCGGVAGNSTNFTVNGTVGNGTPQWTVTGGTIAFGNVTLSTPGNTSTGVSVAAGQTGTVILTLTTTSNLTPPCNPPATDTVTLTITAGAVAVAPADMSKCQIIGQPTVFNLDGQVTAGSSTPLWSYVSSTGTIVAGDVTIATPNNTTTSVSVAAGKIGSVTVRLTAATTACGSATDDVILTIAAAPTANAGADLVSCAAASGSTVFNLNGAATNASATTWSFVSSTGTIVQGDVAIAAAGSLATTASIANGKTGTVTLALTATSASAVCANAGDEIVLTTNANPSCLFTGATAVCATSTGNTYTGPAGANLSYNWSVTGNGSIVGSNTGQSVNVTAGAAGSYTVSLTVTDTSLTPNCSSTCNQVVTVNANPTCSISGATAVCATSTGNTYTAPAGANLSYNWSVTGNGSIVGSNTGQSVNVTAGAAGSYTVNLTVTNTQTNCTSSCNQQVTVNANPTCLISGATAVCATSTGNTYTGPAGANLSYSWSVTGNGSIVGATNGQSVSVNAGASGSYTVNLTVRDTLTNCSTSCTQAVTVNSQACSITGPDTACLDSAIPTVYSGPAGAASYSWSVSGSGAVISGPANQQTVSLTSPDVGTFTLTLTVTSAAGCSTTCTKVVTECDDCGPKGPGLTYPRASEASDQKSGSVLIYNLYTSSASAPNTQNTRLNITNTSQLAAVAVHLFFVDGTSCSVADSYLCLTPNQTSSFLASDFDPGTTGYLVAVAVDCNLGCPINFNCLIGDEYIKMASGHAANLGAEAIASQARTPVVCDANSVTAVLNFDGIKYNRLPRVLSLDSVGSKADGNDTLLVINRIGGNLGIGAATLGSMFGIFHDDAENALSYTFTGSCQLRSSLSNSFPRITPRFETFIPAGRTGWTKFWIAGDDDNKGILGASLNFNANAGTSAGAYSQGHNLHALRLDRSNSYTIPVFPPSCCR